MKKKIAAITAFLAAVLLLFSSARSAVQTGKSTLPVIVPHYEYGISSVDTAEPTADEKPTLTVINPHYECVFLPSSKPESLPLAEEPSLAVTDTNNESVFSFQEEDQSSQTQDKSFKIVHHEAEYKTVHHDAKTVHHEAQYKTVHHSEEGHYETVITSPAWDETIEKEIYIQHVFCNERSCHMDFTSAGYSSNQIWDHLEAHALKGEASGHHTEDIKSTITETIHHEAITSQEWVVDKPARDEQVLTKDAWDEVIPAYDERVLIKEAWDEKIPG